ncbi:MAG: helix-turn-helix domain-containing protein [Proteobacteria bacterium]|nr:helix-turn-helix domain-containing protein [Pseudomonadota bacterium]
MEKRWLTVRDASEYLGAHEQTIYIWAQTARIPSVKIGGSVRIDRKALDRALEAQLDGKTINLEGLI